MNSTSSDIINPQPDRFTFTVPMTVANHQVAEKFCQQHADSKKARQVYLNTLSVQAVKFYLDCLGIQTSLEQSQSWNAALQVLVDTADLWVEDLGHLECRPLLSDETVWAVPAQVWSDRIGYVAVQFNPDVSEATLLGFVPSVETENLLLEELQPLDHFPDYLNQLVPDPLASNQVTSSQVTSNQMTSSQVTRNPPQPAFGQSLPTKLSQLTHQAIETGWKTIETLMEEMQMQPALSFRTSMPFLRSPEEPDTGIKRGKLLLLKTIPEVQLLFLIEIAPKEASEYQIKLELYPEGKEVYFPQSLQVSVLDEAGKVVLQAKNSNSEGLEFQFSGELGEQFSVSVGLDGYSIVEAFEI